MEALTLANAGAKYIDPDTKQPIVEVVNINTKVNLCQNKFKRIFSINNHT